MSTEATVVQAILGIAVALILAHMCGLLAQRIGQPAVIGQMFAGIALGPSLLGRLPGGLQQSIFPDSARPALIMVSQLALVLFLFTVGYELDLRVLRGRARAVPAIVVSTLVLSMGLGVGSTVVFAGWYRAAGVGNPAQLGFVLFIAVAFAITAVPVLARIIDEHRLVGTVPGVVSMAAAGVMDGLGWVVLAAALFEAGQGGSWTWTAALLLGYVAVMVVVVGPVLRLWSRRELASFQRMWPILAGIVLISAWVTGALGVHVIFGALLAGLIMPRRSDGSPHPELMEPAAKAGGLLLPIFFVVSGLSVDIGALRWNDLWLLLVVCVVATAGKLVAGLLAARASAISWHESVTIGLLLNTRGLTELIALNAGLTAGIIGGRLYTIFVLMALITTAATGPALTVLARRKRDRETTVAPAEMVPR